MIVDSKELTFIEGALEEERRLLADLDRADQREEDDSHVPEAQLPAFFGRYPHLILALDFDEYVVLERPESQHRDPFRETASDYGIDTTTLVYGTESIYRETRSGAWYIFDGLTDPGKLSPSFEALHFVGPKQNRAFAVEEWLGRLSQLIERPDGRPRTLWLPGQWTPTAQADQRRALKETVGPVVGALQDGTTSLRELHWRELEEVVAVLLAERGLKIEVTPRTRDGGRDIVARGELVPGEPMQIAIEVKQKAVVGLEDVQRALYANADYPALMIATAGRFSAGVVGERGANSMRLFLKDGMALGQWLSVGRDPTDLPTPP